MQKPTLGAIVIVTGYGDTIRGRVTALDNGMLVIENLEELRPPTEAITRTDAV